MKKLFKYFAYILLVGLVVIQFFQAEENKNPAFAGHRLNDAYKVPTDVDELLKASCFDCHSNNTESMWYMKIQPIGWWIADHIEEGKSELNFDEFGTYGLPRQFHKFEEIAEMVGEGEMPLSSYTLVHDNAKLDEGDVKVIVDWANSMQSWMKETYPADSLVRK